MNKPLEITLEKKNKILNSFKKVFKHKNINFLTKDAYNFIMLASGFIAHYNVYGFKDVYQDVEEFSNEIKKHKQFNQWTNFYPGERDYEYYMTKKEIYNSICDIIDAYEN